LIAAVDGLEAIARDASDRVTYRVAERPRTQV